MPYRMTDTYDVIVAGAGHNGLTAAAYFSRLGLRTPVLEARSIPGGMTRTEETIQAASAYF